MYQTIHESIAVVGTYAKGAFCPRKFRWNNKVLSVETITLVSDFREGQTRKRMYALLCQGTVYRVLFDRDRETWMLEEVWME